MKWYIDFLHHCPVWVAFIFFFFISTVWFLIGKKIKSQVVWKRINVGVLIAGVFLIVWYTLLSRIGVEINEEKIVWIPFQKDTLKIPIIWTWRAAVDNVLLFLPLGMSVSQLSRKKMLLLLGLVVSLVIEITQYVLGIGVFETEDVFCNTGGYLIPWMVCCVLHRLDFKKCARAIETMND